MPPRLPPGTKAKRRVEIHIKTEPHADIGETPSVERKVPEVKKRDAKEASLAAAGDTTATAAQGPDAPAEATSAAAPPKKKPTVTDTRPTEEIAAERVHLACEAGLDLGDFSDGKDRDVKQLLKHIAESSGKTEKALREAFKRTNPAESDARVSHAGSRNQKVSKMDASVAEKMLSKADNEFWLGVWLHHDRNWDNAKSTIEDKTEEIEEEGKTFAWLMEGQLQKVFQDPIVVAAWKKECTRNRKLNRAHPVLKLCARAHQYKVQIDDSNRQLIRTVLSKATTATADVDAEAASMLLRRSDKATSAKATRAKATSDLDDDEYSHDSEEERNEDMLVSVSDRKKMEETMRKKVENELLKKAEEAEAKKKEEAEQERKRKEAEDEVERTAKAAKAARLAAEREQALKDPKIACQKWLAGLAELLAKLESAKSDASIHELKNNMHETYKDAFEQQIDKLKELREYMETNDPKRSDRALRMKLTAGTTVVNQAKADMLAFDGLLRNYKVKVPVGKGTKATKGKK